MRSGPDPESGPEGPLHLVFPGDMLSVRKALRRIARSAQLQGLSLADRGSAELVLAEVLNNIVEHAYRHSAGDIALTLFRLSEGLAVQLTDTGSAMPGCTVPAGRLPEGLDGPAAALPEGGFGWFLVHSLTRDLVYERTAGQNRLGFTLPFD